MQILKSLFCYQGHDNRKRFFVISNSTYLIFIILSLLLPMSSAPIFIIMLLCACLLMFTLKRRLNDSKQNKNWSLLPTTFFMVICLIILLTENNSLYWLLLFPIVLSNILLTYPTVTHQHYILGYAGPVDLTEYNKPSVLKSARIEPTLEKQSGVEHSYTHEQDSPVKTPEYLSRNEKNSDLGETIRITVFKNKKLVFITAGCISMLLLLIIISAGFSSEPSEVKKRAITEVSHSIEKTEKLHSLTMPDDVTLYLSPNDGITLSWIATSKLTGAVWDQRTGSGDRSCLAIQFNNSEDIRTLDVIVEDNTSYLANFSPLDTTKILKSLAKGSYFTICDYKFSLKGSQAAIGKNGYYSDLMEQ